MGNIYLAGYFGSSSIAFGSSSVTNNNGGNKETVAAKLHNVASGVENADHNSLLNVYPNPFAGKITVNTGNSLHNNIAVYNVLGEKISEFQIYDLSTVVDLSKQQNGIYFIQIKNPEGNTSTQKIVLNK